MTIENAWRLIKKKLTPYKNVLTKQETRALEIIDEIMKREVGKERKYKEFEKKLERELHD